MYFWGSIKLQNDKKQNKKTKQKQNKNNNLGSCFRTLAVTLVSDLFLPGRDRNRSTHSLAGKGLRVGERWSRTQRNIRKQKGRFRAGDDACGAAFC